MDARRAGRRALAVLLFAALGSAPAPAAAPTLAEVVRAARAMNEAGRPDEALRLLEEIDTREPRAAAQAFLVRSTAGFMLGLTDAGRRDLERALELDPELRQGWLNLAALEISEGELERALESLEHARRLDPEAADVHLNSGAVLLMQGRADEAAARFERYLEAAGDTAEGWYLVATNYALNGIADAAVQHLARAIDFDERIRLRARTDANFEPLAATAGFQSLLNTDRYRIPAGSHATYRRYPERYRAGQGKLLPAVLDALQLLGEPFDPRIEVTAGWALIWGEMRVKVRNDGDEGGRVELTAPAERFSRDQWRARTDRLFSEIALQIAKR